MSRASKVFLASSAAVCGVSIWGVHWLQERESDNMYQGVVKDEARMRAKALSRSSPSPSPSSSSSSSSIIPLSATAALPPPTAGPSLLTGAATTTGASASLSSVPAPVTQPAPVIADDCETCRISPPPQLLEAQSADQRRVEREARQREYEEQKGLAARLRQEQGQTQDGSAAGRLVDRTDGQGSSAGRLV